MGEHLTPEQVEQIARAAAKIGRFRFRDAQLIRIAFRHGMRASELIKLQWDQIDLKTGDMMVRRLKRGKDMMHPINAEESRALWKLRRKYPDSPYVFCSERGGPLTASAFQKIVARAGRLAGLPFPIHPHMLRHACGYRMANEGWDIRAMMDFLGHRTVAQTIKYTALSSKRFRTLMRD